MSLKIIDKRIVTLSANAAKLNAYIHVTAVMVMEHAKAHGDCTRALSLVKAMPASMRRTMLIAWFAKYSPIAVKLGDSEAVGFSKKYNNLKTDEAKAAQWDIEAAKADPFYAMAEAVPEAKEYNLAALINMVKVLSKRINEKVDEGKVAANDVEKAKELTAKIDALVA